MKTIYANQSQFCFDPIPATLALDATGLQYETPVPLKENLADLSQLSYLRGKVAYHLKLSGASGTGATEVKLMAGTTELASEVVDLTAGTDLSGSFDVDLFGISGAAVLSIQVNGTTAAGAGITASFAAKLTCTHPVVVLG